ncbi:hypothetical protein H6F42_06855 [Pseudanabaena sp. FACHB-1998]|uniref:hypothetical protein n=1 Tax=Pseudanabaena sp. FACHB-1998 TaxID=2692858 RepID=UPI0016803F2E|nr:hypothetical protein [Pseudanabaena sp. FACHB-1998]MBD2176633.1 hypothetical protein [Pseudanabaena sp. FACHB-1998]
MSFNNYKSIAQVLADFPLIYQEQELIPSLPATVEINPYFLERLQLVLSEGVVFNSEYAICENIISPILLEVWLTYRDKLLLWSHQPLNFDDQLSGVPDYIVAKRSPRGKVILEHPYLILVEAKKDNFEEGWGQCLAEMVAAQKLNNNQQYLVFGVVSNGKMWEFGSLQDDLFTKNIRYYTLENLSTLMGALHFIFNKSISQIK